MWPCAFGKSISRLFLAWRVFKRAARPHRGRRSSKIMAFGVMMTPALVVDGEVKVVGQMPSVEEIKKMIA